MKADEPTAHMAFIHLHGRDWTNIELFDANELDEAKDYVLEALDTHIGGELRDGKWKETPDGAGIMYWPGDPWETETGHEDAFSTKGYILEKSVHKASEDAVEVAGLPETPTTAEISSPKSSGWLDWLRGLL